MVDKDFFIILDRLHETLDKRVKKWHNKEKRHKGVAFGLGKNRTVLCQMLVDRMTVAYDLASAFWYLHENKYVTIIASHFIFSLKDCLSFTITTNNASKMLRRIVYRDIKPQNIGFDIRGKSSFGLSLHVVQSVT